MRLLLFVGLLAACSDTIITKPGQNLDGFIVQGDGGAQTTGDKRVFVTSTGYVGNLTTTEAQAFIVADMRCQTSADAAGLGGGWVSWLSNDTTDAIARIQGQGPWFLLNGKKAFSNRANLSTQPLVALNVDENGGNRNAYVWTGTETGGATAGMYYDCAGWTSGTSYGIYGDSSSLPGWTHLGDDLCGYQYSLYCFEK